MPRIHPLVASDFMPTPPVENELLYRQVGPGGNPIFYDPAHQPALHHSLFLPSKNDTDGLSLIRSRFRTEIWSAHRLEQPTIRFRLAKLQCVKLGQLAVELGFQVISCRPTSDSLDDLYGEPWGHCVVNEINRTEYEADQDTKKRIKEWALGVAKLITDQDVIGPYGEPTADDPYRPASMLV